MLEEMLRIALCKTCSEKETILAISIQLPSSAKFCHKTLKMQVKFTSTFLLNSISVCIHNTQQIRISGLMPQRWKEERFFTSDNDRCNAE